ncbi:MAG: hypothetical protein ABG776_11585, partial [Cyanobacteria bacterium J06555_13]
EDYLKAADLLEQQGETGPAASLREQAQYFSEEPTPPPTNVTPDAPVEEEEVEPGEAVEPDAAEEMIPVEPDGGIGDGATPIPEAE